VSKRAILVIGPPRSGTSVVSHVVNKLGVNFGDPSRFVDPEKHTFNPIFFELQSLNDLNDEMFAWFGKSFGKADWIPDRADFEGPIVDAFQDKVAALVESEIPGSDTIGFKDTRFCFTLPLWEGILGRLGYEVGRVLVRRAAHPTFASNQSLNHYSDAVNFRLVAQATLAARHFLEGREFEVVRYEELLRRPRKVIEQLATGLRLNPARIEDACTVVRRDMNHQADFAKTPHFTFFSKVLDVPAWSPGEYFAYREIAAFAKEGEESRVRALEHVVADRDRRIAELSGAAETLRDEAGVLNREAASQSARVAELTQALAEREARIAELMRDRADREDRIAGFVRELAERDARIAELVQDLAARDERAAGLARDLAERDGRIAELVQDLADRDERAAGLARDLAERDGLNASLGHSLQELDAKIAAAMGSAKVREERIAELEHNVAQRDALLEQVRARQRHEESVSWRVPRPRHAGRLLLDALVGSRESPGIAAQGALRAAVDWPPAQRLCIVTEPCFVSGWAADLDAHAAAKVRVRVGRAIRDVEPRLRSDVKEAFSGQADLPADTGFVAELDLAPGLHRVVVEAQAVDGQWVALRRTRVLRLPAMVGKSYWRRHTSRPVGDAQPFVHGPIVASVDWPAEERLCIVTEPCFVSGWAADLDADAAAKVRVRVGRAIRDVEPRLRSDVKEAFSGQADLPADTGFAAELDLMPGLHRVVVEAQAVDGQWVAVRRTRVLRLPAMVGKSYWRRHTSRPVGDAQPFVHGPIVASVDWPAEERLCIVTEPCFVSGWAARLDAHAAAKVRVRVGRAIRDVEPRLRSDVKEAFSGQADLPADTGFAVELDLMPGLHRVVVEAQGADGQWVAVRRTRVLRLPAMMGKSYWRRHMSRPAGDAQPFVHGPIVASVDWPPERTVSTISKPCVVSGWAANLDTDSAANVRIVVGSVDHPWERRDRLDVQHTFATMSRLPLATGFAAPVNMSPGLHRVVVEAELAPGYWVVVRRTFVLRLPGRPAEAQPSKQSFVQGSILATVDWPPDERLWVVSEPCVVSGWGADLEAGAAATVRVLVDDAIRDPEPRERADVTGTFAAYSLPVATGFAAPLDLALGMHRVVVEAKVDGQWMPLRRARIFRVPRVFGKSFWRRESEAPTPPDQPFILGSLFVHLDKPGLAKVGIVPEACEVSGWSADLQAHSAARVRVVVNGKVIQPYAVAREDVRAALAPHARLPLETGFKAILSLPIGLHRTRVQVETSKGDWVTTRRMLLFRLPFLREGLRRNTGISYPAFVRRERQRLLRELPDIRRHIDVMRNRPAFTVLVDARRQKGGLQATLRSLERQWYQAVEVLVVEGARAERPSHEALPIKWLGEPSLADAKGEFAVFLESGEALRDNALYEFASAINHTPEADLIYGDEDLVGAFGRHQRAFHKPDWSADYLETFNYIGFAACYRKTIAATCLPAASRYDFVLRFTERAHRVMHLEQVVGHRASRREGPPQARAEQAALDVAALEGRLLRTGRRGTVREHALHRGCYDIRLQLARTPRVSVVLPTAGKTIALGERRIDLIVNVVSQLRHQTDYPDLEIIVIDNGDLGEEQLRALDGMRCIRATYTEPVFNIAKKLNLGAALATGELLVILNDDIEVLHGSWVQRMVEQFEKPHVGVVGGKLLYPDGLTQHVGVVHNGGNPDHVRRMRPRDEAGYFFSTCGVRNYAAVTGACMMTPASLYREVGGYSEELAVSFNDVDYCFKAREKGLSVVYAPGVELVHMESQSRVAFADPKEVAWFHKRWASNLVADRFYNEQFLTCAPPTFEPQINARMV
jgi:hypothetical protein